MQLAAAFLLVLSLGCSPDTPPPPKWQHLSIATSDLPAPPANWKDQIACLAADFDRDGADFNADGFLDIVSKPFRWETPRVDVWIQHSTGKTS